jgi:hypothetical protein
MHKLIRLENVSEFLQMFKYILVDRTRHPIDRALALCLLTGRRTCEILGTGRFSPVKGTTYCAEFRGQVKTHGRESVFIIPLLAPYGDVQQCMEDVRQALHVESISAGFIDEDKRRAINKISVSVSLN